MMRSAVLALILLALAACSTPGEIQDAGHEMSVAGAGFLGGTLASGGNPAIGAATGLGAYLADILVPTGEEARADVAGDRYRTLAKDQLDGFLGALVDAGLAERITPALRKGFMGDIERRVGEAEAAREETRSTIDQLRDLVVHGVGALVILAVAWVALREWMRRRADAAWETRFRAGIIEAVTPAATPAQEG